MIKPSVLGRQPPLCRVAAFVHKPVQAAAGRDGFEEPSGRSSGPYLAGQKSRSDRACIEQSRARFGIHRMLCLFTVNRISCAWRSQKSKNLPCIRKLPDDPEAGDADAEAEERKRDFLHAPFPT